MMTLFFSLQKDIEDKLAKLAQEHQTISGQINRLKPEMDKVFLPPCQFCVGSPFVSDLALIVIHRDTLSLQLLNSASEYRVE